MGHLVAETGSVLPSHTCFLSDYEGPPAELFSSASVVLCTMTFLGLTPPPLLRRLGLRWNLGGNLVTGAGKSSVTHNSRF